MLRILLQFRKALLAAAAVAALAGVAYLSRHVWLPWFQQTNAVEKAAPTDEAAGPADKIVVGDQAQKNLKLSAMSLRADTFWKAMTIPGTVVDRPGFSDREVVAPAIGLVSEIHHVPGDIVRPGDLLFTLKLTGDALHETQTELFKTSQEIKPAQARLKRLVASGEGIAQARVTEVESEIKRLEVAAKASREHLLRRGFSPGDIDGVAEGDLVSEIPVVVPAQKAGHTELAAALVRNSDSAPTETVAPAFDVQELKVEGGQQVQAGQTLCRLSNHQLLVIEGRAFRDETPLLERAVKENWPVEVDFQESASADWPAVEQTFRIRHIANTVDPATRTFAVLLPLANQSKTIESQHGVQRLWRFRPGQKVWLRVPTEKLDNVFVLPADAVVREGPEAYWFTQNVNTFERKGVHFLYQDCQRAVIANDGSLPTYRKNNELWTIPAVVQSAAAQLNRMTKAGASGVPKGYHIHADGSLHKNEDEGN